MFWIDVVANMWVPLLFLNSMFQMMFGSSRISQKEIVCKNKGVGKVKCVPFSDGHTANCIDNRLKYARKLNSFGEPLYNVV